MSSVVCVCAAGMEPGGGPQFCDTICSKTLFYLRSTLTAAFQPDYDFTDAKSEEFSLVPSVKWVVDAVRSNLSAAAGKDRPTLPVNSTCTCMIVLKHRPYYTVLIS